MTNNKQHNEFEIIRSIRAGNIEDYRILVDRYKDVSFTLAMSILKNSVEAEDALQEAFIKAFRNLKRFKFNASFSTWLYRIVVNTCLSHLKSRKSTFSIDEHEQFTYENSQLNEGFDNLVDSERKAFIQSVIQTMKTDEALLLNLFYLSELSIDEIKEVTQFKESKVKVTLHRARNNFKKIVEENINIEKLNALIEVV